MEFRKTEAFDAGVGAVNANDPQKLYPLLERTVEKLHTENEVLTSEEMEVFATKFGLSEGEAGTIVRLCTFVFSKALEVQATEEDLALGLKEVGVAEQHCLAFGTAWKRKREEVLRRIKKKGFGAPASLESVDWRVHLQVKGSDPSVEQICPKAVLDLHLLDQSRDEEKKKALTFELDRKDLEKLYNNFEEIQSQLDALS
ncbi:COMM domain-containing protein [Chloropicon primus]|uniref:COMM domain-containing protein n=1 Tax=Chloropicon primus TaxID=1764295 RepID=A0A5B8MLA9_9CHLO|nr:hypothetical protein A3770_04p32720 [Chloropicon primus]UPQ99966.1 COMM domain-containing protein [Chloropicon primus]|eukprot:QDZ20754.1 hypothetical protein A3770_04p32720 [Chloropicon primus]